MAPAQEARQPSREPGAPVLPELEHTDCTSCGSSSHAEVARVEPWGVRRCSVCGMAFVSPRPSAQAVAEIYDEHYFDGTGVGGNHSEPGGYQANPAGYRARALTLVRLFTALTGVASGRWLDVGCGPGYSVEAVQACGFKGVGVDVSAAAVGFARDTLGLDVRQASAEGVAAAVEPPFAVASMFDTLFHLREPRVALGQACSLLEPGGFLFAGPFDLVPEGCGLARVDECPDVSAWGIPEHLSFVNQRSMSHLLSHLGLDSITFVPMPLSPSAVVSQRFRFVPPWLSRISRHLIRRFPRLQTVAHSLAGRAANPSAGYVLARRPGRV